MELVRERRRSTPKWWAISPIAGRNSQFERSTRARTVLPPAVLERGAGRIERPGARRRADRRHGVPPSRHRRLLPNASQRGGRPSTSASGRRRVVERASCQVRARVEAPGIPAPRREAATKVDGPTAQPVRHGRLEREALRSSSTSTPHRDYVPEHKRSKATSAAVHPENRRRPGRHQADARPVRISSIASRTGAPAEALRSRAELRDLAAGSTWTTSLCKTRVDSRTRSVPDRQRVTR